jgi:hypothetical protein
VGPHLLQKQQFLQPQLLDCYSYTAATNPYQFGFGAPPHTTAPTHKKGKGGKKTSPSGMGGAGPSGNPSAGGFGTGGFSGCPSGFGNPTGFAGGFGGSGGGFGNPGGSGNPGGGFGRAPSPSQFASAGFASHSARAPALTLYQPPGLDNFIYDRKTGVKPFLRKFKDLCNQHGWTEEIAMCNIQYHLKKSALHMYNSWIQSQATQQNKSIEKARLLFKDFVTAFTAVFDDTTTYAAMDKKARELRYEKCGSSLQYYYQMLELLGKMKITDNDKILMYLLGGLPRELVKQLHLLNLKVSRRSSKLFSEIRTTGKLPTSCRRSWEG